MELTITETGLIGLVGMLFGFLISCCKTIEQSRCTDISFCGASCSRTPLHDDTILNLQEEGGEIEMKNNDLENVKNPMSTDK
jgi:hypothetical protein